MAYLGNKNKIIDELLKIIPYSPIFIDMCCGGGSVAIGYSKKHTNELIVFNDIVSDQVKLLERLLTLDTKVSDTFLFDLWITREYFIFLRDGGEDELTKKYKWFRRFVLVNWSFGNNLKGYMYGKHLEGRKKAIHDTTLNLKYKKQRGQDMIDNAKTVYDSMTDIGKSMITLEKFINRLEGLYNSYLKKTINPFELKNIYARILSDIRIPKVNKTQLKNKELKEEYTTLINMQLQSLESLESLESLQSLQSLESLEFTSQSMFEFDYTKYDIDKTIVYLDPPYEDTHGYGTEPFDYDYFREFVNNHPYPMIISSYKARDHIKEYRKINKRKTISGNTMAVEKIFVNKSFIKKHLDIYNWI